MPELRSCASVEAALLLLLLGIDSGPRAVANVGSGFDLTNNTIYPFKQTWLMQYERSFSRL